MTADHQRVKEIFLEACEMPLEAREAFLISACAGDAVLRSEVDELLQHHRLTTLLRQSVDTEAASRLIRNAIPDSETLTAGTIIAQRYRIVSLLGQGGMGEVYRADDLELDQPVALKFLTADLHSHPAGWEWVRNEVRLAHQITHPHVVRIYDLIKTDGRILVSMEYVRGEDLSTLIKRIGRLSEQKLSSVARQLAAGLSAAHRSGILHRDLKPSNVMLDDRGQVRILDFGIALAVRDGESSARPGGTPGFIAPEVLAGQPPSVQSDLYAYGLVCLSAATGSPSPAMALAAAAPIAARARRPSFDERDPELERVVMQCLESDPRLRPGSADEIIVRLSEADPLDAALDAGQLPSPALVAAARTMQLSRRQAFAFLGIGVGLLILVLLLADRSLFLPQCGLAKSPTVLADIARHICASLGDPIQDQPQLSGVILDDEAYEYLRTAGEPDQLWNDVRSGRWPVVFYWHRLGDVRLPRLTPLGDPTQERVPSLVSDAVVVRLDGHGHLLTYRSSREELSASQTSPGESVDWDAMFVLAGLQPEHFVQETALANERFGPLDRRQFHTWRGPHPASPHEELVVHGASIDGHVVWFDLRQPWEQAGSAMADNPANRWSVRIVALRTTVWILIFTGGLWLAWWNTTRGYGDLRGARRLAALVGALVGVEWLVGAQHTFAVAEEIASAFSMLCFLVFAAVTAGVLYLSVEPYARRYWPRTLTGWSRVVGGRWRDPVVGQELLIGAVVGLAWVILLQLDTLIPAWFGVLPARPKLPELGYDLADFFALEYKVQVVVRAAIAALTGSLLLMFLLLIVHLRWRNSWLSNGLFAVIATLLLTTSSHLDSALPGLAFFCIFVTSSFLITRVSLLSLVAARFVMVSVLNSPLTLQADTWFAATGAATAMSLLVVLAFGYWTATRIPSGQNAVTSQTIRP